MNKWFTFFKERTPFVSYVIMCLGPAISGFFLNNRNNYQAIAFTFLGFLLFFIELRLMDEFKDYSKDILAHPTRPLPRGLIDLKDFQYGIFIGLSFLIVFDVLLLFLGYHLAFILYSFVIFYMWMMYKEFYIGEWLNNFPIIYAISHQIILIPLCLFSTSFLASKNFFTSTEILYSFSVLFAFFSYEVCRKLDPNSHPVLKTYLQIYGIRGVSIIIFVLSFFHVSMLIIFFKFKSLIFLFPIFLLLILLLNLRFIKIQFKIIENLATINLIIFLYSGIFYAIIS